MEVPEDNKSGQNPNHGSARLDRALTVGGYLHDPQGRYKPSTAALYASAWGAFDAWCRSAGRTSMPATPETIATYAVALLEIGYVPETIKYKITAIRSRHRILGHPVPDNVPAWTVLSGAKSSRVPSPVNGISRADLLAVVRACPNTTIGIRNRAIAHLAWDVLLPIPDIVALDITHIDDPGDDTPTTIRTTRPRAVDHDHIADPSPEADNPEYPMCAACAIRAWITQLRSAGITTGALLRPVDFRGVIADSGIRRPGTMAPDSRLTVRSIHRVWARMVADARITPCTPRALRLGGAQARVAAGQTLFDVIDRACWSTNTASVVTRLIPGRV